MTRYQLTNRTSGLDLGIYEAPTAYDAIDAAAAALGTTAEALIADIQAVPVAL